VCVYPISEVCSSYASPLFSAAFLTKYSSFALNFLAFEAMRFEDDNNKFDQSGSISHWV
jgi:hypothetical protein